jgi:hypothetical protein
MAHHSRIVYPKKLKQYATVEEFIQTNNLQTYYDALVSGVTAIGLDPTNTAHFNTALTNDNFCGVFSILIESAEKENDFIAHVDTVLGISVEQGPYPDAYPFIEETELSILV